MNRQFKRSTRFKFNSRNRLRFVGGGLAMFIASAVVFPTGAASASPAKDIDRIQALVFQVPLPVFLESAQRQIPSDRAFDWSSDLCSAPLVGSVGRSFDFRGPCRRHDFAYRNFKTADRVQRCPTISTKPTCAMQWYPSGRWWNSSIRHRIDRQFLADMTWHCSNRARSEKLTCLTWAHVFFRSVRVAGGP